jgi:ISXO2-like transposase domain
VVRRATCTKPRLYKVTSTEERTRLRLWDYLSVVVRCAAHVVPSRRKSVLQAAVKERVEPGSALYTDFLLSYEGLAGEYAHQVVDHAKEYVNGQIHTNGLENFWSLLKQGLNGTYVSVEPFHLFRYLDEQTFRYNHRRGMKDAGRFSTALRNVSGKRLTYSELTGKEAGTL